MKPPRLPGIQTLRHALAQTSGGYERLVAGVLERMERDDARHVFTRIYREAALAAARHADALQRTGVPLAPLAGLPVSIKDLFDVAGEPTLAGSIACRNDPPAVSTAPAIARLQQAGAAIVGKTNMTEFAFSGVGLNPHHGTPRNPMDPDVARIPGGSSCGAAVSVALGLSVAGIGSDTGGSIRIPAALCGLVGFKGSQQRVPRQGAFELSRTLDTVCAIATSVEDCLLVDGLMAGGPLDVRPRAAHTLHLAVPKTLMFDDIQTSVARAFDDAVTRLSAAGALITELALTELAEATSVNAPGGFAAVESFAVHRDRLASQRGRYDPRVASRILLGEGVSAADYLRMHDARAAWRQRMHARLRGFDALLCPTVPLAAPAIDALAEDEAFFSTNRLLLRNTFPINLLDGCAFSLPCHGDGELPVGLMLAACNGEDARLASVALAVAGVLEATGRKH